MLHISQQQGYHNRDVENPALYPRLEVAKNPYKCTMATKDIYDGTTPLSVDQKKDNTTKEIGNNANWDIF